MITVGQIKTVLDQAWDCLQQGNRINVCFRGDAGLGKSRAVQQWAKAKAEEMLFSFTDLRSAYKQRPDFLGMPIIDSGLTSYAIPSIFPREGNGVLVFEEFNRGNEDVCNCLMEVLTEGKIESYTLPKGILIVACINPDSEFYTTNATDTALLDRFVMYDVEYDKKSFLDYARSKNFHPDIINFIDSGMWTYQYPDKIGTGKYLSPRKWEQLDWLEKTRSKDRAWHRITSIAVLGEDIGLAYTKFCFEESPILVKDLKADLNKSLKKLKQQSSPEKYRGDMIACTVKDIESAIVKKDIEDNIVLDVLRTINADQALALLKVFCEARCIIPKQFFSDNPDIKETLRKGTDIGTKLVTEKEA